MNDLVLVVEKKNENGKDLVHMHGKVNPEKVGVESENDISAEEAHRRVMGKWTMIRRDY